MVTILPYQFFFFFYYIISCHDLMIEDVGYPSAWDKEFSYNVMCDEKLYSPHN